MIQKIIDAGFKHELLTDKILFVNADCMDVMELLNENESDLAIVDPPYGINHSQIASKQSGSKYGNAASKKRYYDFKEWDSYSPKKIYFDRLKNTCLNQIIWGINHFSGVFNSSSSGYIFWDKNNGSNGFSDGELAFTSFNKGLRKFEFTWNGMIQGNMKNYY